jgi:hypothetical protein
LSASLSRWSVGAVAFIVGSALGAPSSGSLILSPSRPAARLNGMVITVEQVRSFEKSLLVLSRIQGTPCGERAVGESPENACARYALTILLQDAVARRTAAARGLQVGVGRRDRLVENLRRTVGRQAFEQILVTTNVSLEQLTSLESRDLTRAAVRLALARRRLSRREIERAYREHSASFTYVRLDQVRVARRSTALRLWRIANRSNFASLAKRFSNDSHSAENDGHIGRLRAIELTTPVRRASMKLPVGTISHPIASESGWHIIWVRGREAMPLEQARPAILNFLSGDIYSRWMARQLASLDTRVFLFGHLAPGSGAVECC